MNLAREECLSLLSPGVLSLPVGTPARVVVVLAWVMKRAGQDAEEALLMGIRIMTEAYQRRTGPVPSGG